MNLLQVWYQAVTQSFFSLSVGFGALINYSAHNKFRHNVYRDALIISVTDTFTSLLAGFTIFAILGNLAKELDIPIDKVIKSGTGLAFVSYPMAIAKFDLAPQVTLLMLLKCKSVCHVDQINRGLPFSNHYLNIFNQKQLLKKQIDSRAHYLEFWRFKVARSLWTSIKTPERNKRNFDHYNINFLQVFAVLFFLMLITLGLGSATGLISSVIGIICDEKRHWNKTLVTFVTCLVGFGLGLVYITPVSLYPSLWLSIF